MICFSRIGSFGRLGNQLFQIATCIGLAEKYKTTPKFYPWKYSKYFINSLDQSLSKEEIRSEYREKYFHYQEIPYSPGMDLIGYFQSEKYFENGRDKVLYYFKFNKKLFNNQILTENICSIHIRRTDYLLVPDYHPFLGMEYYKNAMNFMINKGINKFLIFSDDINWCKESFREYDNVSYSEGRSDIEDLYLMSKCSHQIIANSSFSWWGAWLNTNINKIVIAPSVWFGPAKKGIILKDLYCKGWNII